MTVVVYTLAVHQNSDNIMANHVYCTSYIRFRGFIMANHVFQIIKFDLCRQSEVPQSIVFICVKVFNSTHGQANVVPQQCFHSAT